MWKRLIDSGLFEDSYPQRLNASFRYLDEDNQDNFSLKDLIHKGYFVFSYLSIDVEQDSSFAVMDLFRLFDRSGRGAVNIEEFVLGVVEKLAQLKKNTSTISSVVDELLNVEARPTELATKLEKMHYEKLPSFRSNFKSISYIIRSKLKQLPMKTHDHSVFLMNRSNLPSLLLDSIDTVISEIQYYFHILPSALSGILPLLSDTDTGSLSKKAKSTILWNLSSARAIASVLDAGNNNGNKLLFTQLQDDDDSYSRLSDGDEDSSPVLDGLNSPLKKSRGDAGFDADHFDTLGGEAFQGGVDGDLLQILKGLKDNVDDGQLFLLQTAFRSIDSYFGISSNPNESFEACAVGGALDTTSADALALAKSAKYNEMRVNYKRELATGAGPSVAAANNIHLGSSLSSAAGGVGGLAASSSGRHSTSASAEQPALPSTGKISGGFEYELVQDLCETQDQLRKIRMRANVLEMVQNQVLGSSSYYDDVDKLEPSKSFDEMDSKAGEDATSKRSGESGGGADDASASSIGVGKITSGVVNLEDLLGSGMGGSDDIFLPLQSGGVGVNDAASTASPTALPGAVASSVAIAAFMKTDTDSAHQTTSISFESIMSELSTLKACIVERATSEFPLGYLLENEVAVVSLAQGTNSDSPTAADDKATDGAAAATAEEKVDLIPTPKNSSASVFVTLNDVARLTKEMHDTLSKRAHNATLNENIVSTLKLQQEKLNELRAVVEQTEVERNEFMSLTVELQIIREKNIKLLKDDNNYKKLLNKNNELVRHNKELEEHIVELRTAASKRSGGGHRNVMVDGQLFEHRGASPAPSTVSSAGGGHAATSATAVDVKTSPMYVQLEEKHNKIMIEYERNCKEIIRLKSSLGIAEQRVKGALQDQMALHHQLQAAEEDTAAMTANVTKLTRDLEDLKMNRVNKEENDRRLNDLQHEINKKELELAEFHENMALNVKLQNELNNAEKVIEFLENKVSEYSIELERGTVAINQIDNYREQIRQKTKENRDMSLHIHGLETQLKDVPYLQNRYHELNDELQDCKMKMENIPGLLSEIARLRGSSRASVKALMEQDKLLVTLKSKIKMLEKETVMLKNDNRSLQDVENKLKEANAEIKRLLGLVSEMGTLKSGVKNAEEEKKAIETQNKRLKKFVRNSVISLGVTSQMRDLHSHDAGDDYHNVENTDISNQDVSEAISNRSPSFVRAPSPPPPPAPPVSSGSFSGGSSGGGGNSVPFSGGGRSSRDSTIIVAPIGGEDGSTSGGSSVSSKMKMQLNTLLSRKRPGVSGGGGIVTHGSDSM